RGCLPREAAQCRLLRRVEKQVRRRGLGHSGTQHRKTGMNAVAAPSIGDHAASTHGALAHGTQEKGWINLPDAVLGRLTEVVAAVLVAAEILVRLAGVIAGL